MKSSSNFFLCILDLEFLSGSRESLANVKAWVRTILYCQISHLVECFIVHEEFYWLLNMRCRLLFYCVDASSSTIFTSKNITRCSFSIILYLLTWNTPQSINLQRSLDSLQHEILSTALINRDSEFNIRLLSDVSADDAWRHYHAPPLQPFFYIKWSVQSNGKDWQVHTH